MKQGKAGHLYRFFGRPGDPHHWEIDEDERHHLRKVLRLPEGATVEVMDGEGRLVRGSISFPGTARVLVRVGHEHRASPPQQCLALALGALKPADTDALLPALVELGLDEIHLFYQAGTERHRIHPRAVARRQAIVRSAVKQCKRLWLPRVEQHDSLQALLDGPGAVAAGQGWSRFLLSPDASPTLLDQPSGGPGMLTLAGGERGLTPDEEEQLLGAGFVRVSLGPHVLRSRTAAVAAATLMATLRMQRPSGG